MTFDCRLNFRQTLAFVTDPAGTDAVLGLDGGSQPPYPTTVGAYTVGWDAGTVGLAHRDRSAGNDAQLAGFHRVEGSTVKLFRVDLPSAGNYAISYAIGDASYGRTGMYWRVLDNATELVAFANVATSAANHFIDASGVERTSDSDWLTNQVAVTYAFASTIFFIEVNNAAGSNDTPLSHLRIVQIPDATFTAFQGFQSDAFQGPAGYISNERRTAFQQDAFQSDAFQIFGGTLPAGDVNVNTNLVTMTLTTHRATISDDYTVSTSSVALTLTPHAATISLDRNVATTSVAMTLTPHAATVSLGVNIATTSVAMTLTPHAATVAFDRNVATTSVAMTLTPYAASITTTADVTIAASVVSLTLTTFRATISGASDTTQSGVSRLIRSRVDDEELLLAIIKKFLEVNG